MGQILTHGANDPAGADVATACDDAGPAPPFRVGGPGGRRPVIFAGLSIGCGDIRHGTDWIVRGPAAAGDLDSVPSQSLVGIIDGALEADRILSGAEIRRAMDRGVEVLGAGSLGALRAAELFPYGMRGLGRVHRAYRTGRIHGTDEIAVLYHPGCGRPLTVPLVNMRFALDAVVESGRLEAEGAEAAMAALKAVPLEGRDPCTLLRAIRECLGPERMRACIVTFPSGVPDAKARDAWELVRKMGCWNAGSRGHRVLGPSRPACVRTGIVGCARPAESSVGGRR